MGIGQEIIRQEAAERAMARYRAQRVGKTVEKRTAPTLAEVEQQIAEIKAQLMGPGDDPALWPLRKKLVSLHNKRQELLAR
jgi:hypothetical protein